MQGSDGYFYGTTSQGGTINAGTVFKITTNGVLNSVFSFNYADGDNPQAALVQSRRRSLWHDYRRRHKQPPSGLWHGVQERHQWSADHLYSFGNIEDAFHVPLDGASPDPRP